MRLPWRRCYRRSLGTVAKAERLTPRFVPDGPRLSKLTIGGEVVESMEEKVQPPSREDRFGSKRRR